MEEQAADVHSQPQPSSFPLGMGSAAEMADALLRPSVSREALQRKFAAYAEEGAHESVVRRSSDVRVQGRSQAHIDDLDFLLDGICNGKVSVQRASALRLAEACTERESLAVLQTQKVAGRMWPALRLAVRARGEPAPIRFTPTLAPRPRHAVRTRPCGWPSRLSFGCICGTGGLGAARTGRHPLPARLTTARARAAPLHRCWILPWQRP